MDRCSRPHWSERWSRITPCTYGAAGCRIRRILLFHAFPHAVVDLLPSFAQMLGLCLANAAIVERVFSLSGLGYLIIDAVVKRDSPVIHAAVLVLALTLVLLDTVAELLQYALRSDIRGCGRPGMRKHSFVSKAGMILPLLVLCVCAFGFVFAPNDPELVDLTKKFLAPCPEFPLGADNLGRCVLSRLLYGGRTTLGIVLVGSVTVSRFWDADRTAHGQWEERQKPDFRGRAERGYRHPAHCLPDHLHCGLGQQCIHHGW